MLEDLQKNIFFYVFSVIIGIAAVIAMFPPDFMWARILSDFAAHFMIGLLGLGLFFLLANKRRYMFVSFAVCGILCLFLKDAANQDIMLPKTSGTPSISILHCNLNKTADSFSGLFRSVEESGAGILAFNEVTRDRDLYLDRALKDVYPHSAKLVRTDRYGLSFYSKVPISRVDTIEVYGGSRPHLLIGISYGFGKELNIINSYFLPPVTREAYGDYRVELAQLGQHLAEIERPVIAVGDFNLSDWSSELREFKTLSGLSSSRRDINTGTNTGSKDLMDFPNDHILFNQQLQCVEFQTLNDSMGQHLGIKGIYQLRE